MEIKRKVTYLIYLATTVFYIVTGIIYFVILSWCIPLILSCLKFSEMMNIEAEISKIAESLVLPFFNTKETASYLLTILIIAFIQSQLLFLQKGTNIKVYLRCFLDSMITTNFYSPLINFNIDMDYKNTLWISQ